MVSRAVAVVAVMVLASPAHADSPKLEQARKAIDEVRFDDAQLLLVGALADGGNSPAGVREIYKLSASTAVVLGQRDVGEQYYRRWLAVDASASLGAEVAPKLREPFAAAQAYIAAHGRLTAVATRVSATALDVAVTDPLAMAVSATIIGGMPVSLSTERRVRLTPIDAGAVTVAVLDDRGNRLVEITAGPAPVIAPVAPRTDPVREPIVASTTQLTVRPSRAWIAFAIPSAVFLVTGVAFASVASNDAAQIVDEIENSRQHFYQDVADRNARRNTFMGIGGTAIGAGVLLAIPAAVLYFRSQNVPGVVPYVGAGSAGASIVGRF